MIIIGRNCNLLGFPIVPEDMQGHDSETFDDLVAGGSRSSLSTLESFLSGCEVW